MHPSINGVGCLSQSMAKICLGGMCKVPFNVCTKSSLMHIGPFGVCGQRTKHSLQHLFAKLVVQPCAIQIRNSALSAQSFMHSFSLVVTTEMLSLLVSTKAYLQVVQNAAARFHTGFKRHHHFTSQQLSVRF